MGWKLEAVLNITSMYGKEFTQVPTAAVLRPNTTNVSRQLLVLIRGSAFDENRISECSRSWTASTPCAAKANAANG